MKELIAEYNKKKASIKKRLAEFKRIYRKSDEAVFAELAFCLFTPQSKAVSCDKALRELKDSELLLKGNERDISKILRGLVRFHNKKSSYLVTARGIFKKGKRCAIKSRLDGKSGRQMREWLVKNVKGLGYKEASHFLRNIGFGGGLAILDVHILKNLKNFGVIEKIPSSMSKKQYLDIEERMSGFCASCGIPMPEIDLLFWSGQTGFIFK
ncbi:N-glycosylase/DNA lyase [Candidatus Omnitrophota bacterium]